jgi:glycosyltransferase involved in cell wall biosynthesis
VSPEVSVVMSFRHTGPDLDLAISSVLSQTFEDWELLLINDGGSGNQMSSRVQLDDRRIRHLGSNINLGLPARLNQGVALADGRLIARLDADDMMHPERLSQQVLAFQESPDLDVIGSRAFMIDERGAIRGRFGEPKDISTLQAAVKGIVFTHPTVVAKKAWLQQNPYREDLRRSQDKELWIRTFSTSRFLRLDDCLTYYRVPTRVRLATYRETCRADREIYRRYVPSCITTRERRKLVLTSHAKELAYVLARGTRQDSRLEKRRAEPLSDIDIQRGLDGLQRIFKTAGVPR